MRTIKGFIIFVTLSFLFFSIPTNSFSKPLLYGGSKDGGGPAIFDPICMVSILGISSYCPMDHPDSTGSACNCHNQLRTFSGFVVTRQEFMALCRSMPHGSCSDLDPSPELSEIGDETSVSNTEKIPQPDNFTPSDSIAIELTDISNEPPVPQAEIFSEEQNNSTEPINEGQLTLVTAQKPVPLNLFESEQSEPAQVEINFDEILRRHPLRKFKKPDFLEIISDLEIK
jgi:hypothetical protein